MCKTANYFYNFAAHRATLFDTVSCSGNTSTKFRQTITSQLTKAEHTYTICTCQVLRTQSRLSDKSSEAVIGL